MISADKRPILKNQYYESFENLKQQENYVFDNVLFYQYLLQSQYKCRINWNYLCVRDCPGGTECPSGCCPFENAFCCPDNIYCSLSAKFCPKKDSTKVLVQSLPKSKDNCPGGTDCPSGCCPIADAFCCPDNIYCATSASKCPKRNLVKKITSLLKNTIKNCPNGTECPSGCCNILNAFCCPDNIYCATSPENCPNSSFVNKIKPYN
ncbi:GRN [Lepeophtheirus salmonis]|uniref:GRN n=1 Tax=Lepeophtheirus salmonis TaxID=72036 RepID=A0A7R8DCG9_LEPSM|nr:GRN [Lepeophtheirus salmonis]CAF3042514.1 GRN [Lepeophtheirus salmonis]